MGLRSLVSRRRTVRSSTTLNLAQVADYFKFGGLAYQLGLRQTLVGDTQTISPGFQGVIEGAYKANGVVFACELARIMLFSEARMVLRRLRGGRPAGVFSTPALRPLEQPWDGAKTGDLLTRALLDIDFAGTFVAAKRPAGTLRRLRPDWTKIVFGGEGSGEEFHDLDATVLGYLYTPGGDGSGNRPRFLDRTEAVHWTLIPDPLGPASGIPWIEAVIREVLGDQAMTAHKLKFFENGAAQPLDAGVLTPTGWRAMGDLAVGDRVLGPDGTARSVVGVYPQGEKDIYRVTLSGGATTECCEDHLWTVASAYDRRRGVTRTMSLREIMDGGVAYASGPAKWSIQLPDPVEFDDAGHLPLDPYLMGVMLGDGSFRGRATTFSTADAEIVEEVAAAVPAGVSVAHSAGYQYIIRRHKGGPRENPVKHAIRELGLDQLLGRDKFIPDVYLRARIGDRVALLQGLIDTDGYIGAPPDTEVSFTSTSETLAIQVADLVHGLGGIAVVALASERVSEPGRRSQWRVRISRLPEWIIPARLPRKAVRYRSLIRGAPNRHRYIQRVERVRRAQAQCIRVDAEDGLYLTDDCIITHNTPNIVVETDLDGEDLREFVKAYRAESEGLDHAYETMWLASAMKANVVGVDLKQLDFKITQGGGETRVAAAAGVPPVIVGLSEGLQAATYSCPASELVWTADGPRPIALLAPGDKVWSLEQGRPVLRPVTWAGRTGMQVVHTIKTKNRTFHATGNHPVYMPDGSYRLVDDLEVGDRVCAPTSLPDLGGTTLPDGGTATAEIMGWLGAYIGDGCLNGDHGVRMCIPRDDRVRAHYEQLPPRLFTKATAGQWQKPSRRASDGLTEEMVALRDTGMTFRAIRDTMGLEMHPMSVRDRVRTATREYEGAREPVVVGECRYGFQFHSKEAVAWHHLMGVTGTAGTKRVPGWVFGLSEPLRLAFLAGIVDTDGSVGKDGRLVVQFANRDLVEDVRMLLVSCGIQCSNVAHYEYSSRGLPNPGRRRTYEAWRFTASSARDVGRIPFTDPVYRERVDANAHRQRLNRSGTFAIMGIERGTVRVPVYDIEVDGGDHVFLANGVAVHNSNYGQARRRFADGTMRPLWRSFCAAMEPLVDVPADAELWYDDRDIPFLQEDASDDAEILHRNAESIRTLTDAGYTPDSVVAAVMAGDLTQLVHTGLFSVQLLPSGTQMANGNGNGNGNGQAQPASAKPQ